MSDVNRMLVAYFTRRMNTHDPQRLRPVSAGPPVVLVADDDAIICKCVRIALEAAGMFELP
jgi:hypothetical protein